MSPERSCVLKISFIKKNGGTSRQNERVSKNILRSRSFTLDLWYYQHCNVIVEITDIKYGLAENFWVMVNWYKK